MTWLEVVFIFCANIKNKFQEEVSKISDHNSQNEVVQVGLSFTLNALFKNGGNHCSFYEKTLGDDLFPRKYSNCPGICPWRVSCISQVLQCKMV